MLTEGRTGAAHETVPEADAGGHDAGCVSTALVVTTTSAVADDHDVGPPSGDEFDAPRPGSWGALSEPSRALARRSSVWAAVTGFVPFILVLWDFRLDPFRSATRQRFASNFYDIQARALLDGRLSVPTYSFGIEGFVIDGRTYMYFPPWPSILRMPVLLLTDRFDGRLTAPSMLIAWCVLAAATGVLIWNVRLLVRGAVPVTRNEAVLCGLVMATILGGSVIVFDAALPWVYHEVYLWAAAFTVAAVSCLLATARHPTARRAILASLLAGGAILTRTTSGWAVCLTTIAFGVWLATRGRPHRRVAVVLVVGATVALVAGAAVNWAKFRHPYMFPLEHQEWTKTNGRRRMALRMNGGTITGPQFFLTSLVNYFRPDGIRFVPFFPFVTLPAEPARAYGGAFLDQWYRTGSVTAFMPLMSAATVWGFVSMIRRRMKHAMAPLWIAFVGTLLITTGVMFYGYVAHRYINEFLPVLILGSAIGVVDLAQRLESRSLRTRRSTVSVMSVLALFGMLASTATALHVSRTTGRGDALVRYVDVQSRSAELTGRLDGIVGQSDTLPDDGPADHLHILGDCDSLYLATGDAYEPWIAVESREFHVRVKPNPDSFQYGVLDLIEFNGTRRRLIQLEGDGDGRVRVRMGEGYIFYPSDWFEVEPGRSVDVGVRLDTSLNRYLIAVDEEEVGYVAASESTGTSRNTVTFPSYALPTPLDQAIVGFRLTPHMGPRLDLCDRILDDVTPSG